MLPQWQTGIVTRIEHLTHNTRSYWVKLEESSFNFKPGQFVTLDLPIHEQRNKRWRSYSIASLPDGTNLIELIIVHLKDGVASKYIFEEIKEGDSFLLRGPQGIFILPEGIADKELYLICTGTGIAPFRSMLQYISHHQIPHKRIYLIFGTRTREDLLYPDEMRALERDLPAFTYIPVLSREEWEGNTGYVHAVYEKLCEARQPVSFMLCGWRAMIDEAKERILKMGYDKKDIHIEIYG